MNELPAFQQILLTDEQVRGYAASALQNPVLMGLLIEMRSEALKQLTVNGTVADTALREARGYHRAVETMTNRLRQRAEYVSPQVPKEPNSL